MLSSSTKHSIFLQMCSCMLYSSKHFPHTINKKIGELPNTNLPLRMSQFFQVFLKCMSFLVNCQTGLLYTFSSCPDRLSCWNNVTSDKLNFKPNIRQNFKKKNHDVSEPVWLLKQFGATLASWISTLYKHMSIIIQ